MPTWKGEELVIETTDTVDITPEKEPISPAVGAVVANTVIALADTMTLESGEVVQVYANESHDAIKEKVEKAPKNEKEAIEWIIKSKHGVNIYKDDKTGKYIEWDDLTRIEKKKLQKIRKAANKVNLSSMFYILENYSGYGTK